MTVRARAWRSSPSPSSPSDARGPGRPASRSRSTRSATARSETRSTRSRAPHGGAPFRSPPGSNTFNWYGKKTFPGSRPLASSHRFSPSTKSRIAPSPGASGARAPRAPTPIAPCFAPAPGSSTDPTRPSTGPARSSRSRPRSCGGREASPRPRPSTPSSGSGSLPASGRTWRSRAGWRAGARPWAGSSPDGAPTWSDSTRICCERTRSASIAPRSAPSGWRDRPCTASRSRIVDFGRFVLSFARASLVYLSAVPTLVVSPSGSRPEALRMKKMKLLVGLLAIAVGFSAPSLARAQSFAFGKNKVHYHTFQWQTLRGDHVEIFYYPQEEPLARAALSLAEDSYQDLKGKFQHEITKPIPLIVYSSHQHFEQTNVSPYFLPEGVQGFTEFAKGRVVLPYTGSYAEFKHVIHHELVHVFQLSILEEVYKKHRKAQYIVPPLWFSEGLAEYWSTKWDAQGTMVVSDMVLEDRLPGIQDLWKYDGTFTVYKLGQSLCEYIGTTYGDDALRRLYTDIYQDDRFDKV